jgi:cell cycle arrest protein BUB2
LLTSQNLTVAQRDTALKNLRKAILTQTILDPNQRSKVWKLLLGVYRISAKEYTGLIEKKQSSLADKIANDTFRTMSSDKTFSDVMSRE